MTEKAPRICCADGCSKEIPKRILMCLPHWRRVPTAVARRVVGAYESKRRDAWLEARAEAIEAVRMHDRIGWEPLDRPLRWETLLPTDGGPVDFATVERINELTNIRIHVDETVDPGTMFIADSRVVDPDNPGHPTLMVNGQDLRNTVVRIQGLSK